ncbi:hypothetical protein [Fulvimarina sp. MAC3]|uniref:hypothetical protein n=1 Tax=Fulvimarina sp. MAC3 TaxID=3148887 RepID=UPI0031FCB7A0
MDPEQQYPGRRKSNGSAFFIVLVAAAFIAVLTFILIDLRGSDQYGPFQIGTENDDGNAPVLDSPIINEAE